MNAIVDFLNNILWGYVLVWGLLGVGIYFTWRTGFLQFRTLGLAGELTHAPRGFKKVRSRRRPLTRATRVQTLPLVAFEGIPCRSKCTAGHSLIVE